MNFEIKKFDFVTIVMLQKQYQLSGKFEENEIIFFNFTLLLLFYSRGNWYKFNEVMNFKLHDYYKQCHIALKPYYLSPCIINGNSPLVGQTKENFDLLST